MQPFAEAHRAPFGCVVLPVFGVAVPYGARRAGSFALLFAAGEGVAQGEDRQIKRNHNETDDASEHDDDDGFHQGKKRLDGDCVAYSALLSAAA